VREGERREGSDSAKKAHRSIVAGACRVDLGAGALDPEAKDSSALQLGGRGWYPRVLVAVGADSVGDLDESGQPGSFDVSVRLLREGERLAMKNGAAELAVV
jgi:hypothetical protein